MIEIRQANKEDIQAVRPEALTYSCRAFSMVEDGTVIGVAGVYRADCGMVAFSHVTDRLRESPRNVIKLAKRMMTIVGSYPRVWAFADCTIESAERTLCHLGFRHVGPSDNGEVYQWVG